MCKTTKTAFHRGHNDGMTTRLLCGKAERGERCVHEEIKYLYKDFQPAKSFMQPAAVAVSSVEAANKWYWILLWCDKL